MGPGAWFLAAGVVIALAVVIWKLASSEGDHTREGYDCFSDAECPFTEKCLWRNSNAGASTDTCKMSGPGAEGNIHGGYCRSKAAIALCAAEGVVDDCVDAVKALGANPSADDLDAAGDKCLSSFACIQAIAQKDKKAAIEQCSAALIGTFVLGQAADGISAMV